MKIQWFFSDPKNAARLTDELSRWNGTAFFPYQGRAGRGADCVGFCAGVMQAVGAIKSPIEWPPYVISGEGISALNKVISVFRGLPEMALVWTRATGQRNFAPGFGDLMVFSDLKGRHHIGILTQSPTFWHSVRGPGVSLGNIADPKFSKSMRLVYRAKVIP